MHHDTQVEGQEHKPHIILHYNANKGGVDVMDQLATTYTCRRKCSRWPMTLFYNMLDVAAIAALTVWFFGHPEVAANKRKLRRTFLTSLGQQLVNDHIQQRLLNLRSLQKDARLALKLLGYINSPADMEAVEQPPAKRRCVLCPRSRDRKVRQMCTVCNRNVCQDHSTPGVCAKTVCNSKTVQIGY